MHVVTHFRMQYSINRSLSSAQVVWAYDTVRTRASQTTLERHRKTNKNQTLTKAYKVTYKNTLLAGEELPCTASVLSSSASGQRT